MVKKKHASKLLHRADLYLQSKIREYPYETAASAFVIGIMVGLWLKK